MENILMWDSQGNLSEFDKFLIKTNKIGAKSLDELFHKERDITSAKALELSKNPIKCNFDYQHLKIYIKHFLKMFILEQDKIECKWD
nr:hypothetical protein [Campylobacter sp. RM16704]